MEYDGHEGRGRGGVVWRRGSGVQKSACAPRHEGRLGLVTVRCAHSMRPPDALDKAGSGARERRACLKGRR